MTISGDTVCSLIKSFPILLIMAQNNKKCLETPLVYKPPMPTQTPEYYQALDALFHALFVQDHKCDHDHDHGYGYGHGPYYVYGKHDTYGQAYGHGTPCGGPHAHRDGHPSYLYRGLKASNVYNASSAQGYGGGSAAGGHVYTFNNRKYKIVVKHQKYGKRKAEKLEEQLALHPRTQVRRMIDY
ncbi:hypothetical protein EVAR_77713_1 [Eumeta japonica]|uniref:Uncharacterized protein n=1 Tax=Eumeta variegata TaxID=151549 RepID=A0A4C1TDP4_EUMVA|nr:hypothetical protein EVAR_77713_1 [Eumeta japonica]